MRASVEQTTKLPTFRSLFPAAQPEPRRRYPRDTASLALTDRIPCLIGRAGTRERVLASDATFGGGECR